eukprot:10131581-Lingulodinium_polyedra.AAC.1
MGPAGPPKVRALIGGPLPVTSGKSVWHALIVATRSRDMAIDAMAVLIFCKSAFCLEEKDGGRGPRAP